MRWCVERPVGPDGSQETQSFEADRLQFVNGFIALFRREKHSEPGVEDSEEVIATFAPDQWLAAYRLQPVEYSGEDIPLGPYATEDRVQPADPAPRRPTMRKPKSDIER